MLKPNSSFKLSKTAKRLIATTVNKEEASHVKKMFIDAELSAAIAPRLPKRRDEKAKE